MMRTRSNIIFSLVMAVLLALLTSSVIKAATTSTVVTALSADWAFFNDNGTVGDWATGFENGPDTPPLGTGSIFITLNSAKAGVIFGTQKYQGTRLSDIQTLKYSTYTNLSPVALAFQINFDPDVTTVEASTWYGRLIYEPYQNGTVTNGTWQTWDMINGGAGKWWASPNAYTTVGDTCSQAHPCTWSTLISNFPNIGIRNDALSGILFKAGSNWNSFVGNVDNLTIGIGGNTDIYDFEPETPCTTTCYVNAATGSDALGGDTPATAKKTIQAAVTQVSNGGQVIVAAGTYNEALNINKNNITITGAGAAVTTIIGPKPSVVVGSDTVTFSSSGSTLQGFTITRAGNTVAEWNDTRNQGVNFTGAGNTLQNCILTGNRTAVLLASSGHFVLNNTIDNNRTGIHIINASGNNTIRGNQITNNWTIGILYRQNVSGTGDVITDNAITGNWYSQVEDRGNPSGLVRNLQGNWFGPAPFTIVQQNTSGEPAYAATAVPVEFGGTATRPTSTPTFVVNVQDPNSNGDGGGRGNAIVNRLAYSPWLSSGTNSVPAGTPSFQGDFSALDVSAASAQFGGTAIQRGVDMVAVGGTVHVVAGAYVEDLTINQPLTLLGPNDAINPNTGSRVAEAVIQPIHSGTDPSQPSTCIDIVTVAANHVTIKGFVVDGNNPALTSGVLVNGVDVDACEGVAGSQGLGNIVLENNIVQNTTYSGVDFDNYTNPAATSGNYLRYNRLLNIGNNTIGYGIGIIIYDNFYADVTNNVFDAVRVGIQTGNFSQANPGVTGSISNNEIHSWRSGIFHNLWYGSASNIPVSNNTISVIDSNGTTRWDGILFTSFAVPATLSGNTIIATAVHQQTVGYQVWNDLATPELTISGGSVTGANYGVWINNFDGYPLAGSNGGSTTLTVDGIQIANAGLAGVYVKDNPSNTNGATVQATIKNSTLSGSAVGVLVEGADATAIIKGNTLNSNPIAFSQSGGFLTAYANNLTSFATGFNHTGGTYNLRHNWWGKYTDPAPTGVDDDPSWKARLGAAVGTWSDGVNSAALLTATLSGGTGTAVIVSHGRGRANVPFGNGMEPYVSHMCSDFYDFFTVNGGDGWTVNVPVDDSPACNSQTLTPKKLYWIAAGTDYASKCLSNTNKACWTLPPTVSSSIQALKVVGLTAAQLGGTPFVAGSDGGNDPTAVKLINFIAVPTSTNVVVVSVIALLVVSGFSAISLLIRRNRYR